MSNTLKEPQLAIPAMPQDLPYNLGHVALTELGAGSRESFSYSQIIRQTQELEEAGPVGELLVPVYLAAMDESPGARATFVGLWSTLEDRSLRNSPGFEQDVSDDASAIGLAKDWGPY